jgi:hypothetical protein
MECIHVVSTSSECCVECAREEPPSEIGHTNKLSFLAGFFSRFHGKDLWVGRKLLQRSEEDVFWG